jgi:hypothetical protein
MTVNVNNPSGIRHVSMTFSEVHRARSLTSGEFHGGPVLRLKHLPYQLSLTSLFGLVSGKPTLGHGQARTSN